MGSANGLSSEERAVIIAISNTNMSQRAIAAQEKRSETAIQHVLRSQNNEDRSKNVVRSAKVSSGLSHFIVRTVKKERAPASQVVKKLEIDVSVRTIQRILQKDEFTEYMSMKCCPHLASVHREKRLKWARELVVKCASYWRKVTFTDEKRWCLDGSDGYNNYWGGKRLENEVFSKRVNDGGCLMVRAGVSWHGKTELALFIE